MHGMVARHDVHGVRCGPCQCGVRLRMLAKHGQTARAEQHPLHSKMEERRQQLQHVKSQLYGGQLKGKGKGMAHRDIATHSKASVLYTVA